ncbi:hypothetical protein LCGC14_0860190 [marine sediment metagenome]|uniref:Uncharacterized protein n=1 Tax=marine sediment metagenome TaxID=412755 RepID=A0A0F9P7K9_9ZZZZ
MTCIHGLDEINCPTCHIFRSTLPMKVLKAKRERFVKIGNPIFKKNSYLKEGLEKELTNKRINLTHNKFNLIPKPNLINEIPNFVSKMFLERLKELDLDKSDILGIPKKIPLENPEWKFEEED